MKSNNFKTKENSENNINQLPFDVMNNIKLIKNQIGNNDNLMNWVKTQPNFKGIIPYYLTPIVENENQFNSYNFEENENRYYIKKEDVSKIPLKTIEITTDKDCNITSITLITTQKGKLYKVVSLKNYGIIKSRYLLDSKGNFKNYEKCKLIPFEGEYKEYRWNNRKYGNGCSELNKVFNYNNGIKDGECRTYYKGDYPYHNLKIDSKDSQVYWYELITYYFGKKEGLYENTKTLERGMYQNGKRVGEWIVEPPKNLNIPNFNQQNNRSYGVGDLDRIKCNYVNSKLDGKWVGINFNDFFGIKSDFGISPKVGGEFKDGKMDGEFYSDFWNYKFEIIRGEYYNNQKNGEWIYKENNQLKSLIKRSFISYPKDKFWYSYDEISGDENLFSTDEIVDYKILTILYGGKTNCDIVFNKIETFVKNELVEIIVRDDSENRKNYTLIKETSSFNDYTNKFIPLEFQNLGFTLKSYDGWIVDQNTEKYLRLDIKSLNFLGYKSFNNQLLLDNGYSITNVGKNRFDKRKSQIFPSLPSNSNDFYKLGEYEEMYFELVRDFHTTYISLNNEIFEYEESRNNSDPVKNWNLKIQPLIKNVVNLLMKEKCKELSDLSKKESENFSFFPMD